ncbi:MAG: hypothetical protein IPJ00_19090 [Saprospirales bacterium]|nr:hypothetical protein [Saprospirales bacterium]
MFPQSSPLLALAPGSCLIFSPAQCTLTCKAYGFPLNLQCEGLIRPLTLLARQPQAGVSGRSDHYNFSMRQRKEFDPGQSDHPRRLFRPSPGRVMLLDTVSGNSCWGEILVEDKLPHHKLRECQRHLLRRDRSVLGGLAPCKRQLQYPSFSRLRG